MGPAKCGIFEQLTSLRPPSINGVRIEGFLVAYARTDDGNSAQSGPKRRQVFRGSVTKDQIQGVQMGLASMA